MVDDSILIESGDADDAENVDALLGHPALVDYVHPDEQFTVTNIDANNNQFDMSAGKAFVGATSLNTSGGSERRQLMLAAEKTTTTGVEFVVDANSDVITGTQYVYYDLNLGANSAQWVVNTTGDAPNDTSLLVVTLEVTDLAGDGTADRAEVIDYHNRGPEMVAEMLEHPETAPIDLNGSSFENAGHDAVDVPQVRELTVADFEGGTLDTDVWTGDTGQYSVQSSVVESGSHALQADTDGSNYKLKSLGGLKNYPQAGDSFETSFYLTDTDDLAGVSFGKQNDVIGYNDTYRLLLRADIDEMELSVYNGGTFTSLDIDSSVPISSNLNEWLDIVVDWGVDGNIDVTVTDASGSELTTLSASDSSFDSGGIQFYVNNASTSSTAYHDSWTLKRRSPEYFADTAKGTTELGNEVTPSGATHTGPQTTPSNAERGVLNDAPVDSNATQGTQSLLTLLQSGVNPAAFMERTLDGQGGAYGHQLQAALGRFARLNANLSWEHDTLAEVPNWTSNDGGVSNWTFNVNSRPRRIHVETAGDGGSDDTGGVDASVVTTFQSLGGFRITFHDVSFTDNGSSDYINIGMSDVTDASTDTASNSNGILFHQSAGSDGQLRTLNGGSTSSSTFSTDWSNNHDISLEYDGSQARLVFDGIEKASLSFSVNADYKPVIQIHDDSADSNSQTLEAQLATVEPLPEVLQ